MHVLNTPETRASMLVNHFVNKISSQSSDLPPRYPWLVKRLIGEHRMNFTSLLGTESLQGQVSVCMDKICAPDK